MESLTLARRLEMGPLPPEESSRLLIRVAEVVSEWHSQGVLHRELNAASISLGATTEEIEIREPSENSVPYGGPEWDPDVTPAEFSSARRILVPSDLSAAREAFLASGIQLDPTQIDIYQMGTLFCRLLTGQSTKAYLSSPQTKSRIPEKWWPILDRSLGAGRNERWKSAAEFADAIRSNDPPTQRINDTSPSGLHSPDADEKMPFTRVGDFEIRKRIGLGGMGDVFLAYESRLDRHVAVKVLPGELARHSDFVRRFYAEAAAAAKLIHPNIIEILFVGEDEGRHFFAMDYIEGESLAERLKREKPLPLADSLTISRQMLSALAAAHREGLIHRDIKPGNILLDHVRNRAVLCDFGLVKSLEETTGLTATGVVVGSVQYISPEQARGRAVDARSDLYSFGVVLYQMLSGALPFTGQGTTALIFQHVYEPARPLIEAAPSAAPVFGVIVDKLLMKSPADRYSRAEDVLSDLEAYLAGKPLPSGADILENESLDETDAQITESKIIAAPRFDQRNFDSVSIPASAERSPEQTVWWRRLPQTAWDAFQRRAPQLADSMQDTQQRIDGALLEYERRQNELQRVSRKALELLQELRTQRDDWKASAQSAEYRLSQTEDKMACLEEQARCQRNIVELDEQIRLQQDQLSDMRLQQAKVSATLERMRSQNEMLQARIKVSEASLKMSGLKRRRQLVLSLGGLVGVLAVLMLLWIRLDNSSIEVTSRTAISGVEQLISRNTLGPMAPGDSESRVEGPRQRLNSNTQGVYGLAFASGDRILFGAGGNGHLVKWDLQSGQITGEYVQRGSLGPFSIDPVSEKIWERNRAWSLDLLNDPQTFPGFSEIYQTGDPHQAIVVGPNRGMQVPPLFLFDIERNAALQTIVDRWNGAAYAADARILVYSTMEGLHLWSLDQKREIRFIEHAHSKHTHLACVSSDAKMVVFTHYRLPNGTPAHIEVWDLSTGRLKVKRKVRGDVIHSTAFQPGSNLLAVATENLVELWDTDRRVVHRSFPTKGITSMAFSKNGRMLAIGSETGVSIWDTVPDPGKTTGNAQILKGSGPAAVSLDGLRYWSFDNGYLVERQIANGNERHRYSTDFGDINKLLISPKETYAVLLKTVKKPNRYDEQRLYLFNLDTGTVLHSMIIPHPLVPCGFSKNGQLLYLVQGRTLFSLEVEAGYIDDGICREIGGEYNQSLAVSPDGNWIAVGGWDQLAGDSVLSVFNLEERKIAYRRTFKDHNIDVISFSKDSSKFASRSRSLIVIWDLAEGRIERRIGVGTFGAVSSGTNSLAFSPIDNRLASSSKDEAISFWDWTNGDLLLSFTKSADATPNAEWVGFTSDGEKLMATSPGQPVLLFDIEK